MYTELCMLRSNFLSPNIARALSLETQCRPARAAQVTAGIWQTAETPHDFRSWHRNPSPKTIRQKKEQISGLFQQQAKCWKWKIIKIRRYGDGEENKKKVKIKNEIKKKETQNEMPLTRVRVLYSPHLKSDDVKLSTRVRQRLITERQTLITDTSLKITINPQPVVSIATAHR